MMMMIEEESGRREKYADRYYGSTYYQKEKGAKLDSENLTLTFFIPVSKKRKI
jgi:hypothetical protein